VTRASVVDRLRAAGCVFAEDEAELLLSAASSDAELASMVDRRCAGLPLEQVVGWAEFCGLRIELAEGVFVPRRRTEFLVQTAAAAAARLGRDRPVVLDLCCGSGALGAALASRLGDVELYAADVEPAAVRCARRNLAPYGGQVFEGDLDAPLPRDLLGRVDLLLANAPYVPTGEIALLPAEARKYEPKVALDGGGDGLDVLRRVVGVAGRWLAPGGSLFVETSQRQAPVLARFAARSGLSAAVESDDELGATVIVATAAGPSRR
jgi:release factor glutamine methyltransferase